jgi:hypothetical protein
MLAMQNDFQAPRSIFGQYPIQIPIPTSGMKPAGTYNNQYQIMDSKVVEIKTVVVHKFQVGDSEDPDIYAAGPLFDWERSESGQFVMKHAVETPIWNRFIDSNTYGYQYAIAAKLKAADYTFWALKWGNTVDNKKQW